MEYARKWPDLNADEKAKYDSIAWLIGHIKTEIKLLRHPKRSERAAWDNISVAALPGARALLWSAIARLEDAQKAIFGIVPPPPVADPAQFYTWTEARAVLDVSDSTIKTYLREGLLQCYDNKILAEDVDKLAAIPKRSWRGA